MLLSLGYLIISKITIMPKRIDLSKTPSLGEPIAIKELQHLVDRYKNERHKHITKHIKDDTRGAWLSRKKLQEFLDNNPKSTGIRFYYGVIDDVNPGIEAGAHNLIFVPTEKTGKGNTDMLSDQDWVVVLSNPSPDSPEGERESAICPPPKNPCGGNGLTY
jgi:hypothetical protein